MMNVNKIYHSDTVTVKTIARALYKHKNRLKH